MIKNFLLFSILLSFSNLNSQDNQKFDYELLGTIILESNQLISYKVQFNLEENNFIQGYSYTDMNGENETKSYIRGYYNSKSNDIQFKESDILYTKSEFLPEEFCFISFKGKFKGNTKKKTLDGDFIGIYDDRDTCATGGIKLVSTKFVEKKINKIYKRIKKVDKIKKIDSASIAKAEPEKFLKKFSETTINPGESITVFMYTTKMDVELWDYGIEDGDVISILQNDKPIIENLTVSRKKKKITIELQDGKNELKIITLDTGRLKTNTTKLKLYDFRREYELVANLEKGKPSIINVVKLKVKAKQNKKK